MLSGGSWLVDEVTDIVWLLVCLTAIMLAVGFVRKLLHRPTPATGDTTVAEILDAAWTSSTRRRAAALIDTRGDQVRVRSAYVGCDEDTLFEVGSISKALTGMLLAVMSDAGELDLDQPLADLHPEYRRKPIGDTTLRQLARHRSGLPTLPRTPGTFARVCLMQIFQLNPYTGLSRRKVLQAAGRARLNTRGVERYSNLGASVAGAVAADRADRDFGALLTERVLVPAGMTGTGLGRRGDGLRRGWTRHGRRSARWRMTGYAPAGGVVSTPADITSLATWLLTTPSAAQDALRAEGLFWVVETEPVHGRTVAWHNGETGGYSAHLAIYPEAQCAAFVLADTADASAQGALVNELVRRLIAERSAS